MIEWGRVVVHEANPGWCVPGWQWERRAEPGWKGWLLWLLLGGQGVLVEDGVRFELSRGDCFVMALNGDHSGRHDPAHPLHVPWIIFDLLDDAGRPICRRPPQLALHRRLAAADFAGELALRVVRCHREGDHAGAGAWMDCVLRELAGVSAGSVVRADALLEQRIERWCALVRAQPERRFRIADAARIAGMSTDHFIRAFARIRGVTPRQYVIRVRVETARNLLRYGSRRISEIADTLGYCDAYHFSRQFRAVTGVSPSAYRRG